MGRYYRDMHKPKEKNAKIIGSNSTRYDSSSFNLLIGAKKLPLHISPYIIYMIRNYFLFLFFHLIVLSTGCLLASKYFGSCTQVQSRLKVIVCLYHPTSCQHTCIYQNLAVLPSHLRHTHAHAPKTSYNQTHASHNKEINHLLPKI